MYNLAPAILVKGENNWPEFVDVLRSLQEAGIARAKETWKGYEFGGVLPGDNQFGMIPFRPNEMAHDVTSTGLSGTYSFRKNLTGGAWRNIFDYSVREDCLHGFAGFAITDETLKLSQIRMEIGDRKYPIIDLQEAHGWGSFAILFKQDAGKELIAEERTAVLVKAYVESTGYQRIVPLGYQLYKKKDLVISET